MVMPARRSTGRCAGHSHHTGSVRPQRYRQTPSDHATPMGTAVLSRTDAEMTCVVEHSRTRPSLRTRDTGRCTRSSQNKGNLPKRCRQLPCNHAPSIRAVVLSRIFGVTAAIFVAFLTSQSTDKISSRKLLAADPSAVYRENAQQKWYYIGPDNTQQGPISEVQLLQTITAETQVWTDGQANWKKAKDIEELNFSLRTMLLTEQDSAASDPEIATKPASDWYFDFAGEWMGPCDENGLRTLYMDGEISMETMVWCKWNGIQEELGDIPRLKRLMLSNDAKAKKQVSKRRMVNKRSEKRPRREQDPKIAELKLSAVAPSNPSAESTIYLLHENFTEPVECRVEKFGGNVSDTNVADSDLGTLVPLPEARREIARKLKIAVHSIDFEWDCVHDRIRLLNIN